MQYCSPSERKLQTKRKASNRRAPYGKIPTGAAPRASTGSGAAQHKCRFSHDRAGSGRLHAALASVRERMLRHSPKKVAARKRITKVLVLFEILQFSKGLLLSFSILFLPLSLALTHSHTHTLTHSHTRTHTWKQPNKQTTKTNSASRFLQCQTALTSGSVRPGAQLATDVGVACWNERSKYGIVQPVDVVVGRVDQPVHTR